VLEHDLDNLTELRKHDLFSDGADESVDGVHSKPDGLEIGIFFEVFIETFFWGGPLGGDVVLDVDHMEEDHFEQLVDKILVILEEFRDPFSEGDEEFGGFSFDSLVLDLLGPGDFMHGLEEEQKVFSIEFWFSFGDITEDLEDVFSDSLIFQ
jgi:hypothetical protein